MKPFTPFFFFFVSSYRYHTGSSIFNFYISLTYFLNTFFSLSKTQHPSWKFVKNKSSLNLPRARAINEHFGLINNFCSLPRRFLIRCFTPYPQHLLRDAFETSACERHRNFWTDYNFRKEWDLWSGKKNVGVNVDIRGEVIISFETDF